MQGAVPYAVRLFMDDNNERENTALPRFQISASDVALCARVPAQAIQMSDKRRNKDQCVMCLRCLHHCLYVSPYSVW